jgi:hypothetical protein
VLLQLDAVAFNFSFTNITPSSLLAKYLPKIHYNFAKLHLDMLESLSECISFHLLKHSAGWKVSGWLEAITTIVIMHWTVFKKRKSFQSSLKSLLLLSGVAEFALLLED